MISNYNVILLPSKAAGKYVVGDVFKSPEVCSWKIKVFDGLEIKNIDYNFNVRLHFDWNEWEKARNKTIN